MAEIAVVHGYAGSGKSTQCNRLAQEGFSGIAVQHISAGNRLREIRTKFASSHFSEYINASDAPSPLPDEIVSGVIFESIQETSAESIILIDGYPRHPQAVDAFYEAVRANRHRLLGTVAMEISLGVSIDRILARGKRNGEKVIGEDLQNFALHRYSLDTRNTNLAVQALGLVAPVEKIDAGSDVDAVYSRFKSALGKLAAQNQ